MSDLLRRLGERAVGPPAALRTRREVFVPAAHVVEAPPEPLQAVEDTVVHEEPRAPRRRALEPPPVPASR